MSLPTTRATSSSPPIPAYRDDATKMLSQQLEDARSRRARLREAGKASDSLDLEILDLRRRLREGGQLHAGDALGDGRYLLVNPAGRGGFAVVWEAYDWTNRQTVAIKVLHAHLAGDTLRRDRFFRGARVMRQLAGPTVVQVLDPKAEDGGFHYFVMEFLSGGNLSEAVLKGRLARADLLPLMLRVSDAVANAHAMGIIHRDIKPSNVLLDGDGNPKLTDFDLVGVQDTTGGTRTGAMGTLLYAAPECFDKPQDATARADVYGLGMTAIFCLSGKELTRSVLADSKRVIHELPCSEHVKTVLGQAVASEPAERFADAAELKSALRAALDAQLDNQGADTTRDASDPRSTSDSHIEISDMREVHGDLAPSSPETDSASERDVGGLPPPAPRGRSYIVVIGIDRDMVQPHSTNAIDDARGVLRVFQELGFTLVGTPLLNDQATRDALHRLVANELAGLGSEDSLVLFFAGRGYAITPYKDDTTIVSASYLIPGGDYPAGISSWLRLDSWLFDLSRIPARHVLVIFDIRDIRDRGVSLDSIIKWRTRGTDAGYQKHWRSAVERPSRRIITSACAGQLVMDSGPIPGHSLFTGCLIEALTGSLSQGAGHSVVSASEIAAYVQRRVAAYPGSTQTPDWGALELDHEGEMLVHIAAKNADRTSAEGGGANAKQSIGQGLPHVAEEVARSGVPRSSRPSMQLPDLEWWPIVWLLLIMVVIAVVMVIFLSSLRSR